MVRYLADGLIEKVSLEPPSTKVVVVGRTTRAYESSLDQATEAGEAGEAERQRPGTTGEATGEATGKGAEQANFVSVPNAAADEPPPPHAATPPTPAPPTPARARDTPKAPHAGANGTLVGSRIEV